MTVPFEPVAIGLDTTQRLLTVQEAIDAWLGGLRSMMLAMVILILAWGLSAIRRSRHRTILVSDN
jgi:Na+/H+ antiporter NhaC